jgi:hypothetical protein
MKITFCEEAPMIAQLTLSNQAYSDIQSYMNDTDTIALSNDIAFDLLDEMYDGLVPHEDIGEGTYQWVCNFSGGKFYARVGSEDSLWFPQGI